MQEQVPNQRESGLQGFAHALEGVALLRIRSDILGGGRLTTKDSIDCPRTQQDVIKVLGISLVYANLRWVLWVAARVTWN
jgi:hypothetical protein